MSKKIKYILYSLLPILMILLTAGMVTYIFAATKSELLIEGQIGYVREKGTGTEEDPFLIFSVGPNDGTATQGSFNYYAGKNAEGVNYFSSTSPKYYFRQAKNISGTDFTQTILNGYYDGNGYTFTASGGGGALFSRVNTLAKLENLNVVNTNSTDRAGVVLESYGGIVENVTFSGNLTPSDASEGSYIGGVIAVSNGGTIINCTNYANITNNGLASVGGVVGYRWLGAALSLPDGEFSNCKNYGNITGSGLASSTKYVGGVVSSITFGSGVVLKNCINYGNIEVSICASMGGIAGVAWGTADSDAITFCHNEGKIGSLTATAGVVNSNISVTDCTYIGGIVGQSGGLSLDISNSYNAGDIFTRGNAGCSAGGILGYVSRDEAILKINNSYNTGAITGFSTMGNFGGLVGYFYRGNGLSASDAYIKNSYNTGKCYHGNYEGGIVGYANGISIQYCYNTSGQTSVQVSGGIAGLLNNGEILHCYNTGQPTGGQYRGGILGQGSSTTVSYCYSLGEVGATSSSSNMGGGLIGYISTCSLTNLYYLSTISATQAVGNDATQLTSAGKTLTELQTKSTYSGWTFGTYGTATAGWVFVAAEILVNGSSQKLMLPRFAWEEIDVLPTYNVTLNANGGKFGTTTTTTTTTIPTNITYTNIATSATLTGQFEPSGSGYKSTLYGFAGSGYSVLKMSFYAEAGTTVDISYQFIESSGSYYALLSKLDTTLASSYSADSTTYRAVYLSASSTSSYNYSISSTGTHFVYAKICRTSGTTSNSANLTVQVLTSTTESTESTDINVISATVVQGGYVDLSGAEKTGFVLKGFSNTLGAANPDYSVSDNKFYPNASGTFHAVWGQITYTVSSLAEFNQYANETSTTGIGFQNSGLKFVQTADIVGLITQTTLLASYDGCGYTIDLDDQSTIPLFESVGSSTVTTSKLSNLIYVSSSSSGMGGVTNYNYGTIENVHYNGMVGSGSAQTVFGGIVGYNYGTIKDCIMGGSVSVANATLLTSVGGIAGVLSNGSILNCTNTGSVTLSVSSTASAADFYVGGIAGFVTGSSVTSSKISGCQNSGTVIGYKAGVSYIVYNGGIIGSGACILENSFNIGVVGASSMGASTAQYAGGIAGKFTAGSGLSQCYNTGSIYGLGYVGGIVGDNSAGYIRYCYNTGTLRSAGNLGGIFGYMSGAVGGGAEYCYNLGTHYNAGTNNGGIIGYGSSVSASRCFFKSGNGATYAVYSTSSGSGTAMSSLQSQSTYTAQSWTFGTAGTATTGWIWKSGTILVDGSSYTYSLPRLWFEGSSSGGSTTTTCACDGCTGAAQYNGYCTNCYSGGSYYCSICGGCTVHNTSINHAMYSVYAFANSNATVSMTIDGASASTGTYVHVGRTVDLSTSCSDSSKTFKGWYSGTSGASGALLSSSQLYRFVVSSSVTVTAIWE